MDSNWLKGQIGGKTGNFPRNFVTELSVPDVGPGDRLFQAVRSFPAEEQGDLGFQKGQSLPLVSRAGSEIRNHNQTSGEKAPTSTFASPCCQLSC